jgi:uncharacterized protein (DUF433 family)
MMRETAMTASEQIQKLIQMLTPGEKAQVLQWVARDLGGAYPGIESTPDICGGEPRIVRTRISVWLLEQSRRQGMSEAEILAAYPTLRAEDLANAWAYVGSHPDDVARQIRDNEAA